MVSLSKNFIIPARNAGIHTVRTAFEAVGIKQVPLVISKSGCAVIRNDGGQYFLTQRDEYDPLFPKSWHAAGGRKKLFETTAGAAKREYGEEIGLEIAILSLFGTYYFDGTIGCPVKTKTDVYFAKIVSGEPQALHETRDFGWFTQQQIKEMELAYQQNTIFDDIFKYFAGSTHQ